MAKPSRRKAASVKPKRPRTGNDKAGSGFGGGATFILHALRRFFCDFKRARFTIVYAGPGCDADSVKVRYLDSHHASHAQYGRRA